MKEIKRYDQNGNLIYYKDSIGFEEWWVYDNNNLIYHKDWSIEEWYEYDQNGNEIHYKDSNGFEEWRTYDQNNKLISCKDNMNCDQIWKYDQNGNLIYFKDSFGEEYWYEYDQNNNCIHYKKYDGYEVSYEYDHNGNEIYYKDSNGFEKWCTYDQNGNEIYYKDSNGFEEWHKYDHDDCIHFKNNKEEWIYNDNKIIHKQKHCSVEFINLTPDIINLLNKNNKLVFTIKPSGLVASCSMLIRDDVNELGIQKPEGLIELPSPKDNTIYIVSDLIIKSRPNRYDTLTPVDPVVDNTGKIIGYRGLGRI